MTLEEAVKEQAKRESAGGGGFLATESPAAWMLSIPAVVPLVRENLDDDLREGLSE